MIKETTDLSPLNPIVHPRLELGLERGGQLCNCDALAMDNAKLVPVDLGHILQSRSSMRDGTRSNLVAGGDDQLKAGMAVRTVALVLSTASVVGALFVLGRIMYDSWRPSRKAEGTSQASGKR